MGLIIFPFRQFWIFFIHFHFYSQIIDSEVNTILVISEPFIFQKYDIHELYLKSVYKACAFCAVLFHNWNRGGVQLEFITQVDFTCAQFRNNCAQINATKLCAIALYSAQLRPSFLRLRFNFLIKFNLNLIARNKCN